MSTTPSPQTSPSSSGPKSSESKAELVSIEAHQHHQTTFTSSSRTKLEKLLGALVVILAIALLTISILYGVQASNSALTTSGQGAQQVCDTPGCVHAAQMLLDNMDPEVDPCDDFYQFACGGFEKRVRIPDDSSSRTQFHLVNDELQEQLRDILETNNTNVNWVFQSARDLYQSCMDEERIEKLGLEPLKKMLAVFGGWPVLEGDQWDEAGWDWPKVTAKFRANGYSTDYLLDFSITSDIKSTTNRTIYFDEGHLGLSREFLTKGLESETVQFYFTYMKEVATLLGANPDQAAEELEQSLRFEIKLANITLPREKRRNASELYHPMLLKDLSKIAPFIPDWTEYVQQLLGPEINATVGVNSTERVVVANPEYLKSLNEILKDEPKRNVANYMMWRAVRASIFFLSKEIRDISFEFNKKLSGRKHVRPRWKTCTSAATNAFAAAVGKRYVLAHFNSKSVRVMKAMVADIIKQFSNILQNEVTWMDPDTKKRAAQKLKHMDDFIGFPKQILNDSYVDDLYDGLEVNDLEFFQNGINMSIWSTTLQWQKLREPRRRGKSGKRRGRSKKREQVPLSDLDLDFDPIDVDDDDDDDDDDEDHWQKQIKNSVMKKDWKRRSNPAVVNAFYSSLDNSIQFPAGILQGNFFGVNRPAYMNYGGIGWVIGHEITHGYDDRGRQYDYQGDLRDWWEPETEKEFVKKTQCIIEQYSNFTVLDGLNLNGINNQGENIADNGGIKQAYWAYKAWVARNGEEKRLPGLDYKPEQLFWLSAANTWCSKYRPESLEKRVTTGQHSPGMFRVRGSFANSKQFAQDFNCPQGSKMNPVDKCEVW